MKKSVFNWKMKGSEIYLEDVIKLHTAFNGGEAVICPPFTLLSKAHELIKKEKSSLLLGAQNAHFLMEGAFTGEISPLLLKDVGCSFVILGHSERRLYMNESSDLVQRKALMAQDVGLTPILCVGETESEYREERTYQCIEEQIFNSCKGLSESLWIAYEPVWAIGTGLIPTDVEIDNTLAFIRSLFTHKVTLLYGGSVNPSTIDTLNTIKNLDGVLIGGESHNLESMREFFKKGRPHPSPL